VCAALAGKRGVALVATLAAARAETSPRALGRSLATARAVVDVLGDPLRFGVIQQLVARGGEVIGGAELVARLAATLRQDEINESLGDRARALAVEAQSLLSGPTPPPPVAGESRRIPIAATGRTAALDALERALADARRALDEAGESAAVEGTITVRWRR
jgi:hypothetical protein